MTRLTPSIPNADDRALLELAAKGSGLLSSLKWGPRGFQKYDNQANWNPLENDGDALNLAVTAGVNFSVTGRAICVSGGDLSIVDNIDEGDCTRLRLAIVRAAAEIGKQRS